MSKRIGSLLIIPHSSEDKQKWRFKYKSIVKGYTAFLSIVELFTLGANLVETVLTDFFYSETSFSLSMFMKTKGMTSQETRWLTVSFQSTITAFLQVLLNVYSITLRFYLTEWKGIDCIFAPEQKGA